MAGPITQRSRGRSNPRNLATSPLAKRRARDDFALFAQLAIRPTSGHTFRSKLGSCGSRLGLVVLLDRNKARSYKRAMMRWTRVALALLVAFTIAYILITPDLSDDVDGVLGPNHPTLAHKMPEVSLPNSQIPVAVLFPLFNLPRCTRHLAAVELLDVISVCRC